VAFEAIKEQYEYVDSLKLEIDKLRDKVFEYGNYNSQITQKNIELQNSLNSYKELLIEVINDVSLLKKCLSESDICNSAKPLNNVEDNKVIIKAELGQNIPNPFTGSTEIPYFIPESVNEALIVIKDIKGVEIERHRISEMGKGVLKVQNWFSAETYFYTLVIDGIPFKTLIFAILNLFI